MGYRLCIEAISPEYCAGHKHGELHNIKQLIIILKERIKMSNDDIYFAIVDDVWKQIKSKKPITRDEVCEIVEELKNKYIDKVEEAFDEICWDYCDSEDIYDED